MKDFIKYYNQKQDKKPVISFKDYYKHKLIISLIVIPVTILTSMFKGIKWTYIVLMLILCIVLSKDTYTSSKYRTEVSDEMVQDINNTINNIIQCILTIIFIILIILSVFKENTIILTLNFPTLSLIFYSFEFVKSGLFLLLDHNSNNYYKE